MTTASTRRRGRPTLQEVVDRERVKETERARAARGGRPKKEMAIVAPPKISRRTSTNPLYQEQHNRKWAIKAAKAFPGVEWEFRLPNRKPIAYIEEDGVLRCIKRVAP